MKANDYAKSNGKTPFVVYQAAYSVVQRDIEREILPMCRHEGGFAFRLVMFVDTTPLIITCSTALLGAGIALTLWNVLAGGHIRTDEEEENRRMTGEKGRAMLGPSSWERTEPEKKMCKALETIAQRVGAKHITAGTSLHSVFLHTDS